MVLGRIAVGAIIFFVVLYSLYKFNDWITEGEDYMLGLMITVMMIISLYCAISGTYLLYLGGKI